MGDALFTLEGGVLEFWVGGSSRGRYRVADIVGGALDLHEDRKGRVSLRVDPGGSFTQLGVSGIEVPVPDRSQIEPLLAAIRRAAGG